MEKVTECSSKSEVEGSLRLCTVAEACKTGMYRLRSSLLDSAARDFIMMCEGFFRWQKTSVFFLSYLGGFSGLIAKKRSYLGGGLISEAVLS